MTCNECKKRDRCVNICHKVQKSLYKIYVSRRELPLKDRDLMLRREDHLRANRAFYEDRHSEYLPELYRRLDMLTPRQRRIIEMYCLDGLPLRVISRKLGISFQAVSERLRKALDKLRRDGMENGKNSTFVSPFNDAVFRAKT